MQQYTLQFEMVCWEIQDAVKTETTKGEREKYYISLRSILRAPYILR